MKEEVVVDITRVEEGIVDRSGARRMDGLSLVARSWDSDIGRLHVVGDDGRLADAVGQEQEQEADAQRCSFASGPSVHWSRSRPGTARGFPVGFRAGGQHRL